MLEHVVFKVYSRLLSFPVEWISLDMTCGLLDMFMGSCFIVDGLENNTKVLVLVELMDHTSKGG